MFTFDDDAHKFKVTFPSSPKVGLDIGPKKVFVTLVTIPNVPLLEATLASGRPLFNSGLVPSAIKFSASCVVLGNAKGVALSEAQLKAGFEFGFVQGIQQNDLITDFWGPRRSDGRLTNDNAFPHSLEVDTDTSIKPWTRVAKGRFKVEKAPAKAGKSVGLQVSAEMDDHPLFFFNHTLTSRTGLTLFLRSVTCKRVFRTVFCARNKATKDFLAISSTDWQIEHNHTIKYSNNGASPTVTDLVVGRTFPSGGNPANVNSDDLKLMKMAKAGAPLTTPAVLQARLSTQNISFEPTNNDFDPSFWQ